MKKEDDMDSAESSDDGNNNIKSDSIYFQWDDGKVIEARETISNRDEKTFRRARDGPKLHWGVCKSGFWGI